MLKDGWAAWTAWMVLMVWFSHWTEITRMSGLDDDAISWYERNWSTGALSYGGC